LALPEEYSFYIISLGCSKNLVDSEKINEELISTGLHSSSNSIDADIIIINTCGFIEIAKEESIEVIFDTIENKDEKFIAVTGCLSQRYFSNFKDEIPEIDLLYGLTDHNFVKTLIKKINITNYKKNKEKFRKSRPLTPDLSYAYIKIGEGCSNNCSFCAIPLIRGPQRSFSLESILFDAKNAISSGVKELIIIAQDITAYRFEDEDGNIYRLHNLVNKISEIDGVEWIRLLYAYPDHLTEDFINLIASNKKVVPYIDLPFQHISEPILKAMGRKGNFEIYTDLIKNLRDKIPEISIRSTFLVGFPGETDDDFQLLLKFIEKNRIDRVGCFQYSNEEDTSAFQLKNQIPEVIKTERYNRLMEIQKTISEEILAEKIDSLINIIVEEKISTNEYLCRTEHDAPEVDGIFYLTENNASINSIIKARVIDSIEYDLIGEKA
jgi:ribosomal protein S12 methylthiotransferase